MSKFLHLAKKVLGEKNLKLIKAERKIKIFRYFLICAAIFLVIGNVIKINYNATKGYEISKLQDKLAKFQENKKAINIEIANLKSLQSIQERVKNINMEPINEVTYLSGEKIMVVAKK